jgi:homoserine kinase
MNIVRIQVPATTSNLGPGFDTLGIALSLRNEITVRRSERRGVRVVSPIAEEAREGATAMLTEAARLFFRRARTPSFGIYVSIAGEVPIARGLGSSVTARLGVIAGLNELTTAGLDRQALLNLVTSLEHHPDNAAPAIFGGFTAAGMLGPVVRCFRQSVPDLLSFVTLIPRFEISTEKARKLVPASFSKADTIHNLNRAALITAAFVSEDYGALPGLFDDKVHQPYREALIPSLSKVIRAGEKAGALGGWLSGSGSTIICLTLENADAVGRAMQRALPDSDVKILQAVNEGFTVLPTPHT